MGKVPNIVTDKTRRKHGRGDDRYWRPRQDSIRSSLQNLQFSDEKYKKAWEKYQESCRKKQEVIDVQEKKEKEG